MSFDYSLKEFEKRYKNEKNARAKIRLQILLLRKKKYTQQDIAASTNITQGTVSNVCNRFIKEKWSSIYDKPRSGKPAALNKKHQEKLKKAMSEEFISGNVHRGWQTKDVRTFIKEQFNHSFTPRHTRRIMHQLGMSWKIPRPKHKRQNPQAVTDFKKNSRGRSSLWQMNMNSSA
jgi:transposase